MSVIARMIDDSNEAYRKEIRALVEPYRESHPEWWTAITEPSSVSQASGYVTFAPHRAYGAIESGKTQCCGYPLEHPIHDRMLAERAGAIAGRHATGLTDALRK